jgi:serine/threonine protein kinase
MASQQNPSHSDVALPTFTVGDYSAKIINEGPMMPNRSEHDGSHGQAPEGQERQDFKELAILMSRCGIRRPDEWTNYSWTHHKYFWTPALLNRILTPDRVVEELRAYQRDDESLFSGTTIEALADDILLHRRKIFAILTLLERGSCIEDTMADKLFDKDLPLRIDGEQKLLYRASGEQVQCLSGKGWRRIDREAFSRYQYALDPHYLEFEEDGHTPKHEDFPSTVVLPFVQHEKHQQGGYGVVTKTKIYPGCHGFNGVLHSVCPINLFCPHLTTNSHLQIKTDDSFALKQLMQSTFDEFHGEVEALKRFNGFAHDHMVTLLMTWKLNGQYYLLFPLARCDLSEYWDKNRSPEHSAGAARWMLKQIIGITSALDHIHDPPSPNALPLPADHKYGRHGDLKPENLLLYDSSEDSRGIILVADLGLSTLNTIVSRTQTNSRTRCTPLYKPPECHIKGAKIRRSYDLWTLGCLLLEWVCWALEGEEARLEFMNSLFSTFPTGSETDLFFTMRPREHGMVTVTVNEKVLVVSVISVTYPFGAYATTENY